jgi:hypothetical protein
MNLFRCTHILGIALFLSTALFAQTRNRAEQLASIKAPEVQSALDSLEKLADSFEDHFEDWLDNSSYNGTHTEDVLARWSDMLEDEVDDMAESYKDDKANSEFIRHFENSMIVASAINRAMLRKDFADKADSEWRTLRENLNHIAVHLHRPVLPNVTVMTIRPATAAAMGKADVTSAMEQLEASTDRFEDKLKSAVRHSTANRTDRQRTWNRWADMLEDTSDNMLDEWKARDTKKFQEHLERTLMVAEAMNRLMLRSSLSPDAEVEWKTVHTQLNTVARAFGYPVLTDLIHAR